MRSDPDGTRPTRVRIDASDGVTDLVSGEFLTPRFIGFSDRTARVCLVGHQAMLLAGDSLRLEIEVAAGAHLELVEPSATVAYNARGGRATWDARVHVGAGASLTWRSAPFVVAGGADVERSIDLVLDSGGVAAIYETLVLGRHAENGGAVLSHQRVVCDGLPLLVETLDLRDPVARAMPGVLGSHRVLATALLLGLPGRPPLCPQLAGPLCTPLDGPGVLARALGREAHDTERAIEATWQTWIDAVADYAETRLAVSAT